VNQVKEDGFRRRALGAGSAPAPFAQAVLELVLADMPLYDGTFATEPLNQHA
jgi:hypothetical protein